MTILLHPPPEEWRPLLQYRMQGEDVASWQRVLMARGYDLGEWADDGDFGPLTVKRTIRFQVDRGLTPDGRVGPETRANIGAPARQPSPEDAWPFVQAASWRWANRRSIRLIVIHAMEAPEKPSTAEAVAAWFAGHSGKPPRASAHICCDDDSIVRCVRPEHVAWAAPGANHDGYQVELAGRARQTEGEWLDDYSDQMLRLVAPYVAGIARRFDIPIRKLSVGEVRNGEGGFCGHVEVSKAFGKSSHWDPGPGFPWHYFLELVMSARHDHTVG